MPAQMTYDVNLLTLIEQFGSEEKCRQYMTDLRWPDGVVCPKCKAKTISRILKRDQFDCGSCRYQFSVTSGTIFHDSHLPLHKWILALYMMVEAKKSVSALQLKRTLKVAYKTAWYLCHRIREALHTPHALLAGVVEVDETYLGGKPRYPGISPRGKGTKRPMILGAKERGGRAWTQLGKDHSGKTLRQFIKDHVSDDAKAIYTDDNAAYGNLSDHNTVHERVNHSKKEWVRGDVHTNGIEGVWGLFKRCIHGAYHHIDDKHLDRYLDEMEFRFNNRKNPYIFRDALKELLVAGNLTYEALTG